MPKTILPDIVRAADQQFFADREVRECATCTAFYVGDSCQFCDWWERAESLLDRLEDAESELSAAVDLLRVELGRGIGTSISDVIRAHRATVGTGGEDA